MDNKENKTDGFYFKILEGILYISFVLLGFFLAFLGKFSMKPLDYNFQPYVSTIPYIIGISIVVFYIYDMMSTFKKTLFQNAVIIGISLFFIDIMTIVVVFFKGGFGFPRSIFLIGFILQFLLIFISKAIFLKIHKSNKKEKDCIIIASQFESEYIAKKILLDKNNFNNIKYIATEINKETCALLDCVDKIYIGDTVSKIDKLNIIKNCAEINKPVYLFPSLYELALVDFKMTQINDLLVFKLDNIQLTYEQKFMKRILDLIVSILGLVVLSPILIVISIIIKIYDGGPIFYRQERVTQNNKTFNLYKFRTMIVNAEKQTGPVFASDKDPRITPLGRFLRATRIDEFPQLFNVLKGDMSIVGPRPERPFFVEQFNEEVAAFKYRVSVKAGITGLAQILGTYSTSPETKAKYDLFYIKKYSLLLDLKIIFNTISIMFMKDSSKGMVKDEKVEEIFEELKVSGEN